MGHTDATMRNMVLGGLLGLAVDLAVGVEEDDDRSATVDFLEAGAQAFSQDFEREADYVGAYIVARAGYPLDGLPHIWRRLASVNPDAISYAQSHPTTAERFVARKLVAVQVDARALRHHAPQLHKADRHGR